MFLRCDMDKYVKGKIVRATVTGIETYGIFVSLDDYYTGLIHISEISYNYVKDIHDYVKIGDNIYVEVLSVDNMSGHLNLSIKNINYAKKIPQRKKRIVETSLGFKTLEYMLPLWIDEGLKKIANSSK